MFDNGSFKPVQHNSQGRLESRDEAQRLAEIVVIVNIIIILMRGCHHHKYNPSSTSSSWLQNRVIGCYTGLHPRRHCYSNCDCMCSYIDATAVRLANVLPLMALP